MVTRIEGYLAKAVQCEKRAAQASVADLRIELLDMARQWRELAANTQGLDMVERERAEYRALR
jgi:hypothetical protein